MDEKVIIKGEIKKTLAIMIPAILCVIGALSFIAVITVANSIAAEDTYIVIGIVFLVLAAFSYLYLSRCEITVTNRRVYGKAAFGKRVDLPLDSVSAVATSLFKGIAVATSSGKVSFLCIENSENVHKAISELLMNRQSGTNTSRIIKQEIPQSNADELLKYKELLELGVITQEEFNAKKKQLLGL